MAKLFEGRLCKNFILLRLYYKLHGGKKKKKKKENQVTEKFQTETL